MKNSAKPLLEALKEYAVSGVYPMHMPGHKRNAALTGGVLPYDIDITEIPGFGDLGEMRGFPLEIAELAARLYGAESAFPLINGSTGGILAAVRAAAGERGGSLIMSRYSHRAVKNAADLCGLKTVTYTPAPDLTSGVPGSVTPEEISEILDKTPDARAVVVTSPTYDGVVSDVRGIAEIVHSRGIPLITDAAHGAHFGFAEKFPQNAVRLGADIEIVSLHKTLPSMTQTSLLLAVGGLAPADRIARELAVFQTSSPSYVLMASIDRCLRLLDENAPALFGAYENTLDVIGGGLDKLRRLRRVRASDRFFGFDCGKIFISVNRCDITGFELAERLRGFGFETEACSASHVLAMTGIADDMAQIRRFADTLREIDAGLAPADKTPEIIIPPGAAIRQFDEPAEKPGETGFQQAQADG